MDKMRFRPVRGLEKNLLAQTPEAGKLYFALDTKKIYLADGNDFLPMGGNSGIYYADYDFGESDTDQVDFQFTLDTIDGNQIPNKDDLILNTDGCFYRVTNNQLSDGDGNQIIETIKLTVAGSGGTGGGGSASTSIIITQNDSAHKYYTQDTTEAKLSFNVRSVPPMEGNAIINIKYYLGTEKTGILLEDDLENRPFGDIEFDLLPHFSRFSKSQTNIITIIVFDAYGARKTTAYNIDVIELSLESKLNNKILTTSDKTYSYYCTPKGGSGLEERKIIFKFYDESNNLLEDLGKEASVSASGRDITTVLNFNNYGVYTMEVVYTGKIKNSERWIFSNILKYQMVYYGEDPILVAHMPDNRIEQYDTVDIDYMIVSSKDTAEEQKIILIKNNEEVIQVTKYNELQKWSIYFDAAGIYDLQIKDAHNHVIEFNNIIVNEYTGEMPVIDPTQTDLYLSAVNRSNNELHKDTWTYGEKAKCIFQNFIWGNINGWMKDEKNVDMLHLSSGAKLTLDGYFPYSSDKNIMTNSDKGLGQTIELDFKISGTTDFTKPLISCLSYDKNDNIQVGFNITGQESTMNTQNIKATNSEILEGEDNQVYNTAVQGLTTKFIENERIHLTWVIERNYNNDYPLIITYLNGVLSGITKYDSSDSMVENEDKPAKLIIDSTYGDIDIYNIRIYKKPLESKEVLDNYIATLSSPEERVNKYRDNSGLLDNDDNISIESIESGDYILSVPYIKIVGGRKLVKEDSGYRLNNNEKEDIGLPISKKDYRLIESYTFIDQNGKHVKQTVDYAFKEDGYLDYGIVMYGQGTSSMEYPVKNLRFKTVGKINGEKIKFKVNENDCPVNLVCLKADYMESSGSHNTGTGNLIYELTSKSEYKTPAQNYYGPKEDYEIVTAIRGYPIALFYKSPEDETFEFVGKYNFNLDKATQEPFGFYSTPEEMPENGELPADNFGWAKAEDTYTDKDEKGEYKFAKNGYVKTIHCYEFLNNSSPLTKFLADEGEDIYTTFTKIVKNDKDSVPNWALSFESRYPEAEKDDFSDIDISSWYRVVSWVNSCDTTSATNETFDEVKYGYVSDSKEYRLAKFKAEFEDYFDLDFTLIYYVITHVLLMIDSRAKNLMMATWNNEKWYPIFYDMDTMLGLNNYGYNKFNYDVEDTDVGIYNGEASVLWNNFKKCFPTEISTMYNTLRQYNGLNYNNLITIYNNIQADALNEIAFNADAKYKYIRPFTEGYWNSLTGTAVWVEPGSVDYLYASQGRRSMHRKWWLDNRLNYFDGKYLSAAYKADKFNMRLYSPKKEAENYYLVPDLTEEDFNAEPKIIYYIKVVQEDKTEIYIEATSFDKNIKDYYRKADSSRLDESIEVVKPSNDFTLTPLHNQYLSVAYGGDNGVTTPPVYTEANKSYTIKAPGSFGDTETYIYGGSMLKDLGDLSSQYLGKFIFPDKVTKLETLIFGNKNNKYYNPNFSSLEIGTRAPYLKKLDVTNCIGLGRKGLNIEHCRNLQELYATGSEITSIALPEHGIINELRLPSTLKSLKIIDQPYIKDTAFTIGTYDSNTEKYSINNYSNLNRVEIEDVPNLNTYEIVKNGTALQEYRFINVNWKIDESEDLNDNGHVKVLERMIPKEDSDASDHIRPIGGSNEYAKSLTGVLTINCQVQDALKIYNRYWKYFPELDIIFTNPENKLHDIKILDGNNNIYWTKKIPNNGSIESTFLQSGPNGAFVLPEKLSTQQYTYEFTETWEVTYEDGTTTTYIGEYPYLENITQSVTLKPIFESVIREYTVTIIDGKNIIEKDYQYGTKLSSIISTFTPSKEDKDSEGKDLPLELTYKFLGYSISKEYSDAGIILNNIEDIIITRSVTYYTSYKIVSVYDNVLDDKYLDYDNYEEGYSVSIKNEYRNSIVGKITLPTMHNNKPILQVKDFTNCGSITHVFFDNSKDAQIKIIGEKNTKVNSGFHECDKLKYFELPESVNTIGTGTFRDGPDIFNNMEANDIEKFFKNIEFIEAYAFQGNRTLNHKIIQFPGKLKYIGQAGFWNCKVETVIFGDEGDPSEYYSSTVHDSISPEKEYNIVFYDTGLTGGFDENSDTSNNIASVIFYYDLNNRPAQEQWKQSIMEDLFISYDLEDIQWIPTEKGEN